LSARKRRKSQVKEKEKSKEPQKKLTEAIWEDFERVFELIAKKEKTSEEG
jgi:hypothetical protein